MTALEEVIERVLADDPRLQAGNRTELAHRIATAVRQAQFDWMFGPL